GALAAALESRLVQKNGEGCTAAADEVDGTQEILGNDQSHEPSGIQNADVELCFPDSISEMKLDDALVSLPSASVPELMQEELSQLYFDRMHAFAPILHQLRYFSWDRQSTKTESQRCLQNAMWALAASVSAQFQTIGQSLYQDTRQALELLESRHSDIKSIRIEQVQACLLLAIYEFMRSDYCRGWMSAGRAFRLIQLMRLQEIDVPGCNRTQTDWVEMEEKRRTFWVAYALDRFVCIRGSDMHLAKVMVRLPAPEVAFQSGQPVLMGFLIESITADDQSSMSPFTECIVLANISGRALSHRHQSLVENLYINMSQNTWDRHKWIGDELTERIALLSVKYAPASEQMDPLLLFTRMVAQTTVLYLYKIMNSMIPVTAENQATVIMQLNCFKVHPFTPIPLSLCAEFLNSYRNLDDSFASQLEHILKALRSLKRVNNLAQACLHSFELDNVDSLL
ncbi:MAG: hypothetical protein L6R35_004094, partial [Caloplaca aegaea]